MNVGVIGKLIYSALIHEGNQSETSTEISPLDGRLSSVSITEMRQTGKSAAKLRVEKGINSPVDWVEVKIEDLISHAGREMG